MYFGYLPTVVWYDIRPGEMRCFDKVDILSLEAVLVHSAWRMYHGYLWFYYLLWISDTASPANMSQK
jgi:hypothetical protein